MDDALAFDQDREVRDAKARLEIALLARADKVFASSAWLHDQCMARGAAEEKVLEIPNGWDGAAFPVQASRPFPAEGPVTLAYFGTLDAWLDIAALEASVRAAPGLTLRLIGPNAGGHVPAHPRIVIRPPVPHAALADAVADVDAFMLPFRVTELTRAVDPVKLYEYIALGRPILSAYWPGLERFREFVTFYEGTEQFSRLIADGALKEPASAERRAAFLAERTWAARAIVMANALGASASVDRD
jgi:teichuronic acid biosynthesis glycosyltransferase TuaH